MNGEFSELYSKLKSDFDILQATILERWTNHDRQANERHIDNTTKFKELFDRMNVLPCKERRGIYTYLKWHIGILTTIVLGILWMLIK